MLQGDGGRGFPNAVPSVCKGVCCGGDRVREGSDLRFVILCANVVFFAHKRIAQSIFGSSRVTSTTRASGRRRGIEPPSIAAHALDELETGEHNERNAGARVWVNPNVQAGRSTRTSQRVCHDLDEFIRRGPFLFRRGGHRGDQLRILAAAELQPAHTGHGWGFGNSRGRSRAGRTAVWTEVNPRGLRPFPALSESDPFFEKTWRAAIASLPTKLQLQKKTIKTIAL